MEIREMKYFIAIVEEKSLSKAALRLNISEPPLSRMIKKIEDELNIVLFKREKSLILTPEGMSLYEYCQNIVQYHDEMIIAMAKEKNKINQTIRLGIVSSSYSRVYKEVLENFSHKYKDATYIIKEGNTFNLIDLLKKDLVDVAIMRKPFEDNDIDYVTLSNERMSIVSKTPIKEKLNFNDLDGMPLVIYRRFKATLEDLFFKKNLKLNIKALFDDAKSAVLFSSITGYFALVPEETFGFFNLNLHQALIDEKELQTSLVFAYKKNKIFNDYTSKLFLEFKNHSLNN